MQLINIHEAKTHLSRLIDQAAQGEEIVIARNGKPIAKLSGLSGELAPRQPGSLKGQIWIGEDFDKADPEFEKLFYGDGE